MTTTSTDENTVADVLSRISNDDHTPAESPLIAALILTFQVAENIYLLLQEHYPSRLMKNLYVGSPPCIIQMTSPNSLSSTLLLDPLLGFGVVKSRIWYALEIALLFPRI
jgi:hypothetical protein